MTSVFPAEYGERFTFSLVMAVYNTAPFLRETVESLLAQDIGFREHVQLILVDDGSTDGVGDIADEYALRYPQNILVIHKCNGGVSSARNEGLKYVAGKYVNFLDSDDKLSVNALSEAMKFFHAHGDEVDLVSVPLKFFDGKTGDHILNYKYKDGTRVIDLDVEYDKIQLQMGSCFLRREALEGMQFDTRLKFAEDAKVCLRVLAKKKKLGVIANAECQYRVRSTGEQSAIQTSEYSKDWYIPYLQHFSWSTFRWAKKNLGRIPRFIQFTVMYDLQWRFRMSMKIVEHVLEPQEAEEFRKLFYGLIPQVEDCVLMEQRHLWPEHKCFLMSRKHGMPVKLQRREDDMIPTVGSYEFLPISQCKTYLEFLEIKGDCLSLEGYASFLGMEAATDVEIYLQVNGDEYLPCHLNLQRSVDTDCLGEITFPDRTFCGTIENISRYGEFRCKVFSKVNSVMVERKNIRIGKFFPVDNSFRESYAMAGGWMIRMQGNELIFSHAAEEDAELQEEKFLSELQGKKDSAAKEAVFFRRAYRAMRAGKEKELWLISDRINKADDSGEALFRYLQEQGKEEEVHFVLRHDSADFERVSAYGSVVDYMSDRHRILHLLVDKIISTAADDYVQNPFGNARKYYRDILYGKKQVFLQHGITKDNQSSWLNRFNKNFSLFVSAGNMEYESLKSPEYFYDDSVIRLTGFPRYDYLEDDRKRNIVIMPTWRDYLGDNSNYANDGLKKYNHSFTKSKYFIFYNALLNNPLLIASAMKYGYEIRFMPHPNIMPVISVFRKNDAVIFSGLDTRYCDVLSEGSLLITDYSSVAFDFSYLYKPVIYCQFDKEEFFRNHVYTQGYFDYERDGLGEVEYDLEGTVNRIIEYMENGCQLKEKYRKRIDGFFAYHDKNNCKRVYEAIKGFDETTDGK